MIGVRIPTDGLQIVVLVGGAAPDEGFVAEAAKLAEFFKGAMNK